jgi:hypothetical protein
MNPTAIHADLLDFQADPGLDERARDRKSVV